MSSNEIPRTPTPQPESSAGPTVPLSNSDNVEPPVAAAPAKKTRARKTASTEEKKTKKGRACEDCRAKKIGCKHRPTIDVETGAIVPKEPVQSPEPEEPQKKRRRRTQHKSADDDLIESAPVPVAEPAEPAAQPGRQPSASRTRKRGRDETKESAADISSSPTIAGPSQPAQRTQRNSALGESITVTWNSFTYKTFQRELETAKEDWNRLRVTIGIAYEQFEKLVDSMDGMGNVLKEWNEKYKRSCR